MLITDGGVLVRTRVAEVKASSRVTMGVKLIALDHGAQLAGLQKVAESVVEAIEGVADDVAGVPIGAQDALPAAPADTPSDSAGSVTGDPSGPDA